VAYLPKEVLKKECPMCHKTKSISASYYKSASPLFSNEGCVPICTSCVKKDILNDDGTINIKRFKIMLQRLDKPLYWNYLEAAIKQVSKEHGYVSNDEILKLGDKILSIYFKNVMLRQTKNKSFSDSEKENFISENSNISKDEYDRINRKYNKVNGASTENSSLELKDIELDVQNEESEPLIYSDKWMGNYSESDIKKLDHYYESLENDYNIVTENHRDYARKISKASLQMDKTFDDMMNGVDGADKRYDNATKAFDLLSKSAKFSESTRSVNDVGASSFSKVAAMVESHNWIPEHKPLKKDTIDEMIDYLSTITKSL
jgi:hypothetical protein